MKTVIIFNELATDIIFFVVDGDYSHLNNKYVNSNNGDGGLVDIIYEDDGEFVNTPMYEFPIDEVKKGAVVIVAGCMP